MGRNRSLDGVAGIEGLCLRRCIWRGAQHFRLACAAASTSDEAGARFSRPDIPNRICARRRLLRKLLYGLQVAQGGTLPVCYNPTNRKSTMVATNGIGAEV